MSSSFENDYNNDIDLDIENRKKRQKKNSLNYRKKKKSNLNINSPKHIEYSDTNDIQIEPNEDIFNNNKSDHNIANKSSFMETESSNSFVHSSSGIFYNSNKKQT